YELYPMSIPPPRYDGPADRQTDTILRTLAAFAQRMYTAQDRLVSTRVSDN
ncbi:hypothetical protein EDC04DRAFT_2579088, partial [Pisolithus marmoratus]